MKWWKKLLVLLIAGVVCGAIMRVMALWVSKNTLSASAAEQTYGDLTCTTETPRSLAVRQV